MTTQNAGTAGTLQMLGVNVSRGVKRSLKDQLPEDLAEQLGQVFWIAHFRNTNLSSYEFQNRVARRSRATSDPDFAKYPIQAIFGGLKSLINDSLVNEVRDDLSPELSAMWEQA